MTILQAIENRNSVRSYLDTEIEKEKLAKLQSEVDVCNNKGNLSIRLITNEPKAFENLMAHYGKFKNVKNYIVLIGKKSANLDERAGYYGEHLVLQAQMLGLNTCWVALTFSKGAVKQMCNIGNDEKLVCIIALGYGENQGVKHKSKPIEKICNYSDDMPQWFIKGINYAMLAPTAVNQQKFFFTLKDNTVSVKATGGFYSKVDLGIVKYHFEIGADTDNFSWEN